eukprot:244864_1
MRHWRVLRVVRIRLKLIYLIMGQKHIVLDQEVTKNDTVAFIKTLFKIQTSCTIEDRFIYFDYKQNALDPKQTLEEVGLVNENHLIKVKMEKMFAIEIMMMPGQTHLVLDT